MATVLAGLATEDVARLVAARDRAEEAARVMRATEALLRAQVAGLEKLRDAYAKEQPTALSLLREMTSVVEQYEANINPESVCASVGGLLARAHSLLADGAK